MATQEEVEELRASLERLHGDALFKRVGETGVGIGAVMRCLHRSGEPMSAGEISRYLHVSTARVAVLLKKMEARSLIERISDERDARKSVIRLSAYGAEVSEQVLRELNRQLAEVIDRIGLERVKEFIAVSGEIRAVVQPPAWEW